METKRIHNLEFRECSYIGGKPKNPSWEICIWEPNEYYGKEDKFIKDGDYYRHPDKTYSFYKIHKNCFKNPETSFQLASFKYDNDEDCYELHFCGNRPFRYKDNFNLEDFWELLIYSNEFLNDNKSGNSR